MLVEAMSVVDVASHISNVAFVVEAMIREPSVPPEFEMIVLARKLEVGYVLVPCIASFGLMFPRGAAGVSSLVNFMPTPTITINAMIAMSVFSKLVIMLKNLLIKNRAF
jgi:hypothetical protein